MNDSLRLAHDSIQPGPATDLFSVDADTHLKKLAACMFPSPAQLPLELVRAALKRKAAAVEVRLRRRRLTVGDDGSGISQSQWRELACAFDSGREAADREKAIAALQRDANPGIGLLAIMVPGSTAVKVENAGDGCPMTLHIENGLVRLLGSCSLARGTRITIFRKSGQVKEEKKLIRELCAAVTQDIVLNGQMLEKKTLLKRTLARQRVEFRPGAIPAWVAIPAQGDICRIWLLDQGIPWQLLTSASYHGLVFEAALESVSPPGAPVFSLLADTASHIYQWLAEHYLAFPDKIQARIEELLFKKARLGGDLHLLSVFSPFRLWRSKQRLNLEEVRRKAGKNILYALPHDSDPGHFLGRHAEALLLTPLQMDFLLNHLGLPLISPTAAMESKKKFSGMPAAVWRNLIGLAALRRHRGRRILTTEQLDDEEKRLCRELENHWQRTAHRAAAPGPPLPLSVVMVRGRGLAPAFWLPANLGFVLHLRRRHPLTLLALRSVRRDPANIELAFAALAPEQFFDSRGALI
jgi:hypothetical protein